MRRKLIKISKDFSQSPGPRLSKQGPWSAEEFFNNILLPEFQKLQEKEYQALTIDLDGTAGYATSFLEGSFGELQRRFPRLKIEEEINLISYEEEFLIEEIHSYLFDARKAMSVVSA